MKKPRPWTAVATLIAFASTGSGCYSYRVVPLTQVALEKERSGDRKVRFITDAGQVEMDVLRVQMPFVDGLVSAEGSQPRPGQVMVDLRRVRALAVEPEGGDKRSLVLTEVALRAEDLRIDPVVATMESGKLTLVGARLEWPYLVGVPRAGKGIARVDVGRVTRMEVQRTDVPKTVLAVVGTSAGIFAALLLIVLATKESCPFVYVDRGQGWELVGEAYAGAAFQSVQRDDLLPLPELVPGPMRLRLRNEARETQYTDRAELVLVERPTGVRALSSHQGEVVMVGAASAVLSAVDLQGRDARPLVADEDERVWERDLVATAAATAPPLRDGLVAVFDAPDGEPVLELVAGNTPWLDVVFGRFFAAMGDRLDHYLASGNEPAAAAGIHRWKRREGVDLKVEALDGGRWREVAVIPTVGPIALRHIAVPLPRGEGRRTIRITGGPGFWRVDHLALSGRVDAAPVVRRIAPRSARTDDASDARQTLSAVDGRYNALSRMDEAVDLEFDVPAPAAGRAQDAFLLTTGYYNVHMPVQSKHSPRTLLTLRRQPGAFGRFSIDLAREYVKLMQTARAEPAE